MWIRQNMQKCGWSSFDVTHDVKFTHPDVKTIGRSSETAGLWEVLVVLNSYNALCVLWGELKRLEEMDHGPLCLPLRKLGSLSSIPFIFRKFFMSSQWIQYFSLMVKASTASHIQTVFIFPLYEDLEHL